MYESFIIDETVIKLKFRIRKFYHLIEVVGSGGYTLLDTSVICYVVCDFIFL